MKYILHPTKTPCFFPDDLSVRKFAREHADIERVTTEAKRVVYRRVSEPEPMLDIDAVEWFDRAKP